MCAAGMDREEGELSGEELPRQESDGMDLSLSYHTGASLCKPCIPGLEYNWYLQHIWTLRRIKPLSVLNLRTEQLDTIEMRSHHCTSLCTSR